MQAIQQAIRVVEEKLAALGRARRELVRLTGGRASHAARERMSKAQRKRWARGRGKG